MVSIAHISDPHVGSPYFVPGLMERVIEELNELSPDLVVVSGDLTNEGYRQEFVTWAAYQERISSPVRIVPGNHDARNVGYLHFEDLIGPRHWAADIEGVRIVGVDSTEPDLNEGQVGRERYGWIRESFADPCALKVFVLHHHLLAVPGTGRERSTVADAGDLLEVLIGAGVDIVLCGHKHVPYVWRLEDLYIANAGTVSSLRLRGYTKPSYNLVEFDPDRDQVVISRCSPFGPRVPIARFCPTTGEQVDREQEPPVQDRTAKERPVHGRIA